MLLAYIVLALAAVMQAATTPTSVSDLPEPPSAVTVRNLDLNSDVSTNITHTHAVRAKHGEAVLYLYKEDGCQGEYRKWNPAGTQANFCDRNVHDPNFRSVKYHVTKVDGPRPEIVVGSHCHPDWWRNVHTPNHCYSMKRDWDFPRGYGNKVSVHQD